MGFDMFWADAATEKEAALAADGEPDYFRLTNLEMANTRTLMCIYKMVDADKVTKRLPQPVDFDLTYVPQRCDELGDRVDYEPDSAEERYLCAREAARDGDNGGVIPLYKLGSNDGWLVTSAEIERSLAAYDQCLPDVASQPRELPVPVSLPVQAADGSWTCETEEADWWGEWIDWSRAAARHGGFQVF